MPDTRLARQPAARIASAALLVVALAACTGSPGGPASGAGGASATVVDPGNPGPSGVYPKPAKPLAAATYTTDRAHAVTRTAGWRTQTAIETTSADGTRYTLDIPKGALLSDVAVTLTPLRSLSGVPITKGIGGVELQPHGLEFQQPVTLTVTPKGGVPTPSTGGKVGVIAAGIKGAEPHGYGFATVDGTAVRASLTHFSLYYVGAFSPGDLEAILLSTPSSADGQTAQDLFGGEDPAGVFSAWYNDIVDPALDAAEANLDLAEEASRVALGWLRQATLLGVDLDPALTQGIVQRLVNLQTRIYQRAADRCRTDHDIRQVGTIIGASRALALLGDERSSEVAAAVNACLRIEFDVEETIQVKTDYVDDFIHKEASGSWHMKAEQYVIEDWLNEEPDLPTPWVTAPSFRHKQSIKCPSGSGRTDDELNLTDSPEPKWHVNFSFDFNPSNDPSHDAGSAVHGTLELTPIESSTEETAEVSQVDCSDSSSGPTIHRGLWAARFVQFREGESNTPTSISIPIEAGPGDPVIAELHSTKTLPDIDDPKGGKMTETLDVKLTHNPQ